MTRYNVAVEGEDWGNGRKVMPGSLVCEAEKVPVTYGYDRVPGNMLGWATDMQRDEATGMISFEVDLFEKDKELIETLEEAGDIKPSIFATGIIYEADDIAHGSITHGKIREVSFLMANYGIPLALAEKLGKKE